MIIRRRPKKIIREPFLESPSHLLPLRGIKIITLSNRYRDLQVEGAEFEKEPEVLEFVDAVCRDILLKYDRDRELPAPIEETSQPKAVENVDETKIESSNFETIKIRLKYITAIPYSHSPESALGSIETAARFACLNRQQRLDATTTTSNDNSTNEKVSKCCPHCNSAEVLQNYHLEQLSMWRKGTMNAVQNAFAKPSVVSTDRLKRHRKLKV